MMMKKLAFLSDCARVDFTFAFACVFALAVQAEVRDVAASETAAQTVAAGDAIRVNVAGEENLAFTVSGAGDVIKAGAGTLVLPNLMNDFTGNFEVKEGTLRPEFSGSSLSSYNVLRNAGKLILNTGTTLESTTKSFNWGSSGHQELIVSNACIVQKSGQVGNSDAYVGIGTQSGRYGVMRIYGDSQITNLMIIGRTSSDNSFSSGAVYQYDGDVFSNGGGIGEPLNNTVNCAGYGYYELNDGKFLLNSSFKIGTGVSNSCAVVAVHGGEFLDKPKTVTQTYIGNNNGLTLGSGTLSGSAAYDNSRALFYIDGGFASLGTTTGGKFLMAENYTGSMPGSEYAFTVADGGIAEFVGESSRFGRKAHSVSIVNVCDGGTIKFSGNDAITRRGGNDAAFTEEQLQAVATAKVFVNLNGARIETKGAKCVFGGDSEKDRLSAVTIYEKGLTLVRDNNSSSQINAPLIAPTGNGVKSITLPPEALADEFDGMPYITISGDGQAASAVAIFDSKTKRVTGVRVTSAGFGYTTAPTVTMRGGGYNREYTLEATIGENVGGGITIDKGDGYSGSGRFVLASTENTFTGPITINGGMFMIKEPECIPEGCAVVINGGQWNNADTRNAGNWYASSVRCGDFTINGGSFSLASGYWLDCDTFTYNGGTFSGVSAVTCNVFNVTAKITESTGTAIGGALKKSFTAKGLTGTGTLKITSNANSKVNLSDIRTLRFDGDDLDAGAFFTIDSADALDLSNLQTIDFTGCEGLGKSAKSSFVLARSTGGFTGFNAKNVNVQGLPSGSWSITEKGDKLMLSSAKGTIIVIK